MTDVAVAPLIEETFGVVSRSLGVGGRLPTAEVAAATVADEAAVVTDDAINGEGEGGRAPTPNLPTVDVAEFAEADAADAEAVEGGD